MLVIHRRIVGLDQVLNYFLIQFVIQVTRGRFNSEMPRRAFSNTANRVFQFFPRWRRSDNGSIHRRRREARTLLMIFQPNKLRDCLPHQGESGYQHPEPPDLPNGSRQQNRDNDEGNAEEKVLDRLFEREFPATSRSIRSTIFSHRGLRELTCQGLRHKTDIRPARATKMRAVKILGGALRTEHYFPPFTLGFAGVWPRKAAPLPPPKHSTIPICRPREYARAYRNVL